MAEQRAANVPAPLDHGNNLGFIDPYNFYLRSACFREFYVPKKKGASGWMPAIELSLLGEEGENKSHVGANGEPCWCHDLHQEDTEQYKWHEGWWRCCGILIPPIGTVIRTTLGSFGIVMDTYFGHTEHHLKILWLHQTECGSANAYTVIADGKLRWVTIWSTINGIKMEECDFAVIGHVKNLLNNTSELKERP